MRIDTAPQAARSFATRASPNSPDLGRAITRAPNIAVLPAIGVPNGTYALVVLDIQNAGSERVEECSSAVVLCSDVTRELTPEPSIWSLPTGRRRRLRARDRAGDEAPRINAAACA